MRIPRISTDSMLHSANSSKVSGQYAAFGKLIEGIEVVDKIASVRTDYQDRPLEPQQIDFMTVQL